MSVLVDTCIWSALLRRQNPNSREAGELQRLILAGEATKHGAREEELGSIFEAGQIARAVTLTGLMILPPRLEG